MDPKTIAAVLSKARQSKKRQRLSQGGSIFPNVGNDDDAEQGGSIFSGIGNIAKMGNLASSIGEIAAAFMSKGGAVPCQNHDHVTAGYCSGGMCDHPDHMASGGKVEEIEHEDETSLHDTASYGDSGIEEPEIEEDVLVIKSERKGFRPKTFEQYIGQEKAKVLLKAYIDKIKKRKRSSYMLQMI
jgi:hypothetical protein